MKFTTLVGSLLELTLVVQFSFGNAVTVGSDGINASGLSLNGTGTAIGQVEPGRPGIPGTDAAGNVHTSVVPAAVFRRDGAPNAADVLAHAEQVAGIMISTDATLIGVAPNSSLYSSAYVTTGINPGYDHALLAIQQVATQSNVRAVNHSWGKPNSGTILDENSQLTLGLDWSASRHDVLHVVAGNEGTMIPIPTDNFNGMTVGYSQRVGNVWRRVGSGNTFDEDAEGDRTSISLIAPGDGFAMTDLGSMPTMAPHPSGTSFAAPHVTGTVALLQQYATTQIGMPRWDADARRHQVMKAVLMNSADKLIDDGSVMINGNPVPQGGLLGMTRTVEKKDGSSTWLDSFAFDDSLDGVGKFTPLDEEMGAGHLNAGRALTQFNRGEFDSDGADVQRIGWDWGTTTGEGDINRYRFADELRAESFISITLAWDRLVTFDTDTAPLNQFNSGDTFEPYVDNGIDPPDDSVINDLDIYLLPKFASSITQAIAASTMNVGTLEHLFFQIPDAGEYEFWILQGDEDVGVNQDYAVAWWAVAANPLVVQGDYSGDGIVGPEDYTAWKVAYGNSVTPGTGADGNGNGIVDAADYTLWRDHLGQMAGSGGLAAVPEPNALWLTLFGLVLCVPRCRSKSIVRLSYARVTG